MSEYEFAVENIVVSANFYERVPLEELLEVSENVEYEPEQFPGAIYRIEGMPMTALIFSSGKIICTGAKDMDMVKQAVEKVRKLLRKAGVRTKDDYELKIENIVASAKFPHRINLDELAYNLEMAEYEPEQFPGLVYKDEEFNTAFLIFSSGKIICTGAREPKEAKKAVKKLYEILYKLKVFEEG